MPHSYLWTALHTLVSPPNHNSSPPSTSTLHKPLETQRDQCTKWPASALSAHTHLQLALQNTATASQTLLLTSRALSTLQLEHAFLLHRLVHLPDPIPYMADNSAVVTNAAAPPRLEISPVDSSDECDAREKLPDDNDDDVRTLRGMLEQVSRKYTIALENMKAQQDAFGEQMHGLKTELSAERTICQEEKVLLRTEKAQLVGEITALQTELSEKSEQPWMQSMKTMVDSLHKRNGQLSVELAGVRAEIPNERKKLTAELSRRTQDFQAVEGELRDAREIYIVAAREFENEKVVLENRLRICENDLKACRACLENAESVADETAAKLSQSMARCQRLEAAVAGKQEEDDTEDMCGLKASLAECQTECTGLRKQLEHAKSHRDGSVDKEYSKRVENLERTLEKEYKKNASQRTLLSNAQRDGALLRDQVDTVANEAKTKEKQVVQLRKEMSAIHTRMRRMAHVSLPRGAEELLAEHDPDAQRLAAIRRAAREEEAVEKMERRPRSVRRVRLPGNEND